MRAAILGASGYIGGELLRLLLSHPHFDLVQITSDSLAGKPADHAHPNLRGRTELRFQRHDDLRPVDVLFMAAGHGKAMQSAERWTSIAPLIIDLSADFRIADVQIFEAYYGSKHTRPDLLKSFVPGIPEIHRGRIASSDRIAVPGCMATPSILAFYPFAQAGLIAGEIVIDARTGSSGSGSLASPASHHAARSGAMRVFKALGHRHEAEIMQQCGVTTRMSATGVEAVRGIQVIGHANLAAPMTDGQIRSLFRDTYRDAPFVRVVKRVGGIHRNPEPKLLLGTNQCDLGFALSADGTHLVLIGAIDNLVKGGAGAAVHCANVRSGWADTAGLDACALYPM